jgi:SET domain
MAPADDEEPPTTQRKRHCSTYDRLAQWIRSRDGAFVHPHIALTTNTPTTTSGGEEEAHRSLHVVTKNTDDSEGSTREHGDAQTEQHVDSPVVIQKGEVVLRIPDDVLIAASRCEFTWVPDAAVSWNSNRHVPRSDVQLALYLASQPSRIRPYLDSLPALESADAALPRCWTTGEVDEYLAGSPVVYRIREHAKQVHDAYDTLASSAPEKEGSDTDALPSFRAFSQCLAVVTSRAFQGFDPDSHGPSCLVPLLDLCNHGRGRTSSSSSSSGPASNVSYRWDADRRAVVSEARTDLRVGDALVITYGAQGNASLLLNYGFCIANNVEPDGSSNDTYELMLGPAVARRVVTLRAGPKEYSYGALVNALDAVVDAFQLSTPQEQPEHIARSKVDDMETFLDECDGDVDEPADATSIRSLDEDDDSDVGDSDSEPESSSGAALHLEMRSLKDLGACLEEARSKYTIRADDVLHLCREKMGITKQHHAAVLVQSEQRTLYFYQRAVHRILSTMANALLDRAPSHGSPRQPTPTSPPEWMTVSDAALIDDQVEALAQVFFRIRHATLDLGP